MKYIIIHEDEKVVDHVTVAFDIAAENLVVVDRLPEFIPREGFNGVLCYSKTDGLYWRYEEAPVRDEPEYTITDEEIEAAYQEGVQEA